MPGATRLVRRALPPAILAGAGLLVGTACLSPAFAAPLSDAARADSLALAAAAAVTAGVITSSPAAEVPAGSPADTLPAPPLALGEDTAAPPPANSRPSAATTSEAGLAAAMEAGMQTPEPFVPPACSLATYSQVGDASWYGPDFHGQPTASGETFDALALTVAHPNLPLGSVIQIENLDNGRRTYARVNDRGPFLKDRIVDCSYAVAHMLGFVAQGLARVQVTVLDSLAVVPPLLPGANMAMVAMEHLPPLRLASAIVSRTAVRVPCRPPARRWSSLRLLLPRCAGPTSSAR